VEIGEAKALGEIQVIARRSKLNLVTLNTTSKSAQTEAATKDEVDEVLKKAYSDISRAIR
jgi:hypothetical protein